MGLIDFHSAEFYWILLFNLSVVLIDSLISQDLYLDLLGFSVFFLYLDDFTRFNLVLLVFWGFAGFHWV